MASEVDDEVITYYLCEQPRPLLLLRRTVSTDEGVVDESFLDGKWQPTKPVTDFMFGHDDNVTGPISEEAARAAEPAAFL